jgi:anti-sigma B factor antagonist
MPGLEIELQEGSNGPPTLRLIGELDAATSPDVHRAVQELIPGRGLAIDMADVTFIDSTGLHVLLDAANMLDGEGALTLLDVPARVLQLMEIVGLTGLASIQVARRDG